MKRKFLIKLAVFAIACVVVKAYAACYRLDDFICNTDGTYLGFFDTPDPTLCPQGQSTHVRVSGNWIVKHSNQCGGASGCKDLLNNTVTGNVCCGPQKIWCTTSQSYICYLNCDEGCDGITTNYKDSFHVNAQNCQ